VVLMVAEPLVGRAKLGEVLLMPPKPRAGVMMPLEHFELDSCGGGVASQRARGDLPHSTRAGEVLPPSAHEEIFAFDCLLPGRHLLRYSPRLMCGLRAQGTLAFPARACHAQILSMARLRLLQVRQSQYSGKLERFK
jgi:hypothetical protein